MSTDRDTTRIVRSWLRTDEHESADRVLDAVLDRLDTTPQRRAAWWPARRFPEMNNTMRVALATAVVAMTALLGFSYFVAPNIGSPGPGDPELTATPTSEATPSPAPAPLEQQDGALEPGSYVISDVAPFRITITVPDGWEKNFTPATVWAAPGSRANLSFGMVDNLYTDPCVPDRGLLVPPVGPAVDDFVTALGNVPGLDASTTDVTVSGFGGTYLELTVSDPVDRNCGGETETRLWDIGGGESMPGPDPFEGVRLWILDVDGDRLVITARVRSAATLEEQAELQTIVDSIHIESP